MTKGLISQVSMQMHCPLPQYLHFFLKIKLKKIQQLQQNLHDMY